MVYLGIVGDTRHVLSSCVSPVDNEDATTVTDLESVQTTLKLWMSQEGSGWINGDRINGV